MKKFSLLFKYLVNRDYRDYRRVRTLHVFDPDYFMQLLQRLAPEMGEFVGADEDPLWSYFGFSRKELAEAEFDQNTWRQLCDPHPLFDSYFYVSRNQKLLGGQHPFAHYLLSGWKRGLQPSPFFDSIHYAEQSGWSMEDGNPLVHFIHHGIEHGLSPSKFFDNDWYKDQVDFAKGEPANTVKHYKLFGPRTGKCPLPVFDPQHYARTRDDEAAASDPFLHYLCTFTETQADPAGSFETAYYRERYLQAESSELPLIHYLRSGVFQGYEINAQVARLTRKPVISIVVPVYNVDPRHLRNCIRSVFFQSYPYWELILVDDCSADEQVRETIAEWSRLDSRITALHNRENFGISKTTQKAVEAAQGEFLGFLDNDDELDPDCLYQVAMKINETNGSIFYTDEDLIGDYGSRQAAFYKPDFNKALLFSHNYITHFVVVSKDLYQRVGGLSADNDGAQDYDLMLKLSDSGEAIYHIPQILYHWRAIETSTSIAHDEKPYAHEAGKRALEASLLRNQLEGQVVDGPINFHYRLELNTATQPSVSVIVIEAKTGGEFSGKDIPSKTDYENATFHYLGGNENQDSSVEDAGDSDSLHISKTQRVQDIIDKSDEDYIAILGHGAADLERDWLHELVSITAVDPAVGIVCGRAYFDGTDGPSYAIADLDNDDPHYLTEFISCASRHAQGVHNLQWIDSCDWHICLISRTLITEMGGFDVSRFPEKMAMLDLSYRVAAAGKKILYNPAAVLMLAGQALVNKTEGAAFEAELAQFRERHRDRLLRFEQQYNIGSLIDRGYSREMFYQWLTGMASNQDLTEQIN